MNRAGDKAPPIGGHAEAVIGCVGQAAGVPRIRCGDHVDHKSGEQWVVAYVEGDRLAWCGWPPGTAAVADCVLVKSCDDAEHLHWLKLCADMHDQTDPRCRKAVAALAALAERVPA